MKSCCVPVVARVLPVLVHFLCPFFVGCAPVVARVCAALFGASLCPFARFGASGACSFWVRPVVARVCRPCCWHAFCFVLCVASVACFRSSFLPCGVVARRGGFGGFHAGFFFFPLWRRWFVPFFAWCWRSCSVGWSPCALPCPVLFGFRPFSRCPVGWLACASLSARVGRRWSCAVFCWSPLWLCPLVALVGGSRACAVRPLGHGGSCRRRPASVRGLSLSAFAVWLLGPVLVCRVRWLLPA